MENAETDVSRKAMDYKETYYIARVKKPHKKFNVGDIVLGELRDGTGSRLVCWGWSSKFQVFIEHYSMRYQGWDDWYEDRMHHSKTNGNGHITIIGEFETSNTELPYEFSEVISRADFIRQLSLFGGNVLELVEAAATHQTHEEVTGVDDDGRRATR